jgi:hypothetical protein
LDYRYEITDMRLKNFVSITVIYHYNFRYFGILGILVFRHLPRPVVNELGLGIYPHTYA